MADSSTAPSAKRPAPASKSGGLPKKIKHYEILSLIGKGGMGEVYLARDTKLDRTVAVKFLPASLHKDPKARERFLREAKAAASLDHPFICKIIEAGEFQGASFIVMEYVEGRDLRSLIAQGAIALPEAFKAILEVAEALDAAHKKGIVHRDLKPANLICTPQGHIKVMDFGLAKHIVPSDQPPSLAQTSTETMTAETELGTLTSEGMVVGTIAYMSPEQARGAPVDARSDIFSIGLILAEMVSGKHPFDRPTPLETLTALLRDSPPPAHVIPKALSPMLSRVLQKALAKDPASRYQNVREFAADIRALQAQVLPRRWLGFRNPWAMAAVLTGSAAILAIAVVFFLKPKNVNGPPPAPKIVKVLISDFENKTGDPVFDGSLEPAFRIELEGAPFVQIFDQAKARELAGAVRLDKEKALLVSRREGINVVVAASIEAAGDAGFRISMQALDPVSSATVSSAAETAKTKAEILKVADGLAAKLRTDLGDLPEASAQDIAKETFTATSIDAMKAYARAQDLTTMGNDDEAIKEYERALAFDPKMGRAFAGLAVVYRNRGDLEQATKYYEKAMPFLDQMTEREKFRTRGGYYFVNRNYRKAIEEYGALMRQFPMDLAAYVNLPLAYFYARDMRRAFEEGRKAVEAYPDKVNPLYNYVWYAIGADRLDVAEAELPKITKLDPKFAEPHVCLALIRLSQGRSDEAVKEYRTIEPMGAYAAALASAGLADVALYEGRLGDARKILEAGIAADLASGQKSLGVIAQTILARTLLTLGDKRAALKTVDSAMAAGLSEGGRLTAAMTLLDAGEEEKALALAKELTNLLQPEPQSYAELLEGAVALKKKDYAGAVGRFHKAQDLVDTWLGHFLLGQAYLEAGQFTEAHSEFETCLRRRGEAFSVFLDDLPTLRELPPVYYYLGRSQEGLKIAAASESYKKFLQIKVLGSGDPMVEDARGRLKNL